MTLAAVTLFRPRRPSPALQMMPPQLLFIGFFLFIIYGLGFFLSNLTSFLPVRTHQPFTRLAFCCTPLCL